MVQHGMQCQYSVEQAPQEAPYRPSKLAIHRKEEMLGVYRFIQTSQFRFIQNIIPPVHLDRHTSGTSRVFIPPVHLDFIHTSGSSRFFFIPLVHLEHHTSGSSRFFSYLWFIQNFIPLVHLEFFCRFLHANCISDRSLVKYDCNLTIF